jgi:predicted ATPase
MFLSELHRLQGEVFSWPGEPELAKAEESFRQAIRLSQDQGAKLFELRAAIRLARLLTREGKREEGLQALFAVYGWFTEGFDTADLKEAKALLDELG